MVISAETNSLEEPCASSQCVLAIITGKCVGNHVGWIALKSVPTTCADGHVLQYPAVTVTVSHPLTLTLIEGHPANDQKVPQSIKF